MVRCTFSPARAWRPAVVARLARTLGSTNTSAAAHGHFQPQPGRRALSRHPSAGARRESVCVVAQGRALHGRQNPSCRCVPEAFAREPASSLCRCARSPGSSQPRGPRRCSPRMRHGQSPARITACFAWFSNKHIAHCLSVALRWSLTPRSSGAPTAGHQARSGGTRYIFTRPGLASCRRRPLSSNVRHHKMKPVASPAGSAARCAEDQTAKARHSREQPAPLVHLLGIQ